MYGKIKKERNQILMNKYRKEADHLFQTNISN